MLLPSWRIRGNGTGRDCHISGCGKTASRAGQAVGSAHTRSVAGIEGSNATSATLFVLNGRVRRPRAAQQESFCSPPPRARSQLACPFVYRQITRPHLTRIMSGWQGEKRALSSTSVSGEGSGICVKRADDRSPTCPNIRGWIRHSCTPWSTARKSRVSTRSTYSLRVSN